MNYTEIKSFEDACKALCRSTDLPDFSMAPEEDRQALVDHYKLTVISKALNGDWTADWNDEDQYKYYPWFYMTSSEFQYNGYADYYQTSCVGSRLCFRSSAVAEYAGTQFIDLYKSYFTV